MADEYIDKVEAGAKIQMMYIRREMDYGGENDFCRGMRKALRVIENMPAADVQPVKRGKWIYSETPEFGNPYGSYICSECNHRVAYKENYCPNCGARMVKDGEQNG